MKIKQMLRWNWQNSWLSPVIVYGVMAAICLLSFILATAAGDSHVTFSGVSMSSTVLVFVLGIVLFSQGLRFGLTNGVSRRSVFWAFGVFMLMFAVIIAAADFLLDKLFSALLGPTNELLPALYPSYAEEKGVFPSFLAMAVCSISLKLATGLFGYFIGGAYYRMNKVLKLVISISVPALLVVVLPIAVSLLPADGQKALLEIVTAVARFLFSTPYALTLVATGMIILFYFFSWLFIRRAPAKAVA